MKTNKGFSVKLTQFSFPINCFGKFKKITNINMNFVGIRRRIASIKAVLFLFICICMLIPLASFFHDSTLVNSIQDPKYLMKRWHKMHVESYVELRYIWPSSILGGILFNREKIPNPNPNANRQFVVLVWKYWNWLKNRHVYNYGKSGVDENNFLEDCSVKNCIFSGNESLIDTADAVVIHLQNGLVPEVKKRNLTQRWIFVNDESPKNAFSLARKKPSLESLYNVFNWSMTYRTDSDVPVPYGRTLPLEKPVNQEYKTLMDIAKLIPYRERKKKSKVATLLMSNCGVKARNDFLNELKQYISIDIYGSCSDKPDLKGGCPGHFKDDCDVIADYMFYLVLENSSCFQYLTEKVFYHAYSKGAIPIIFGPTIEDVESLLPPNSYLHADSKTDLKSLSKDINAIAESADLFLGMQMWRNHFKVVNEHGYFGTKSYHLCRICEALNYNDPKEKVYDKELLDHFLDPEKNCYNN